MSPLSDMQTTIREFLDDLKGNIFTSPEEQRDMTAVEFFFSLMNEQLLMNHVLDQILPFKAQIAARDIDFFAKQKKQIFGNLPSERVDYFEHLIRTPEDKGGMSEENKNYVWVYFDTIIDIAEAYKKNK